MLMRAAGAALGFLALSTTAPAQQQGQETVASLQEFLRGALRDGTGVTAWLAPSPQYSTWATLASAGGDGCTTAIAIRRSDGVTLRRTVDWRRVNQIIAGPQPGAPNPEGGIAIRGGVTGSDIHDGNTDLNAPAALHGKLVKTFLLLRNACAAAQPAAASPPPPAASQQQTQQTVENAQAFLREVLRESSGATFAVEKIMPNGVPSPFLYEADVVSASGGGCLTTITGRSRPQDRIANTFVIRSIEWTRVSNINANNTRINEVITTHIFVQGGVTAYNGHQITLEMSVPFDLGVRIYSAFTFLRNACDSSRRYGF